MKVGWITDRPAYEGGAELTMAEFRAAAEVEVIDCPPGEVAEGLDAYVAHNVTQFATEDLLPLRASRLAWYHHDLSPHIGDGVRNILDTRARHIFCSPLQRKRYGVDGECVPPAPTTKPAPRQSNRHREGAVALGAYQNPGKGGRLVSEWARANGPIDVYGFGDYMPAGDNVRNRGQVEHELVAQTLWGYETFVHLPIDLEPFGRAVIEARDAGCALVVNRNVGAAYYLDRPDALETSAADFWEIVRG